MPRHSFGRLALPVAVAALIFSTAALGAETPPAAESQPEDFAIHGQLTLTEQGNLAFTAPYSGPNSLPPIAEGRETADVTLFVGFRPWTGGEIWLNPEFDQGFGLHNTLGAAGFPSGEAYKVGKSVPYFRLQRLFLRQTVDLGGEVSKIDP